MSTTDTRTTETPNLDVVGACKEISDTLRIAAEYLYNEARREVLMQGREYIRGDDWPPLVNRVQHAYDLCTQLSRIMAAARYEVRS